VRWPELDETKGLVANSIEEPIAAYPGRSGFSHHFQIGDRKLKLEMLAPASMKKTGVIGPDDVHIMDRQARK